MILSTAQLVSTVATFGNLKRLPFADLLQTLHGLEVRQSAVTYSWCLSQPTSFGHENIQHTCYRHKKQLVSQRKRKPSLYPMTSDQTFQTKMTSDQNFETKVASDQTLQTGMTSYQTFQTKMTSD